MNTIEQHGTLLSKAADGTGRDVYKFVVNTDIINRNGWKTMSEGIVYTDFMKSPVFLFAHDDYNFPLGKVLSLEVTNAKHAGKQLIADVWFHEESEESILAKKLVDLGILTSTSIRMKPIERGEPIALTEQIKKLVPSHVEQIEVYTKSDLREVSLVNVPANTGAHIKDKIKSAFEEKHLSEQEYTLAASLLNEEYDSHLNNNSLSIIGDTDMSHEIENVGLKKDIEILQSSAKAFETERKALEDKLTAVTDELNKLKTVSTATAAELKEAKDTLAAKEKEHEKLQKQNFFNEEKMFCDKLSRDGKLPPAELDDTVADLVTMRLQAGSEDGASLYNRTRVRLEKRAALLPQGEKITTGTKPDVFTIRDIEKSREVAEAFAEMCEEKATKEGKTYLEVFNREFGLLKGGA